MVEVRRIMLIGLCKSIEACSSAKVFLKGCWGVGLMRNRVKAKTQKRAAIAREKQENELSRSM